MIKIIETKYELSKLKFFWDTCYQKIPYASFDWNYNCWLYFKKKDEKLQVIYYHDTKGNHVILPLKNSYERGKKISKFINFRHLTDYNYPIELFNSTHFSEILRIYKEIFTVVLHENDLIQLNNVPEHSPLVAIIKSDRISRLFKTYSKKSDKCPRIYLNEFSFTKMSKTYMKDVLKSIQKAPNLKFYFIQDNQRLKYLLDLFFRFNRAWIKDKGQYSLFEIPKTRMFLKKVLPILFDRQELLCSVITINNKPASIAFSFMDKNTFYAKLIANNPYYKIFNIGKIHTFYLVKNAIEQFNLKYFDFMLGNEPYKYEWLAKDNRNFSISISSPIL